MCCGNRVVTARATAPAETWVVVHPDGKETVKNSEISAKLAAARLGAGAKVEKR